MVHPTVSYWKPISLSLILMFDHFFLGKSPCFLETSEFLMLSPWNDAYTSLQDHQRPIHASLQRASSLTARSDTLAFQRGLYHQQRQLWNLEFNFYGGILKWGYPQIIQSSPICVLRLALGIPYFQNPPCVSMCSWPLIGMFFFFFPGKWGL